MIHKCIIQAQVRVPQLCSNLTTIEDVWYNHTQHTQESDKDHARKERRWI